MIYKFKDENTGKTQSTHNPQQAMTMLWSLINRYHSTHVELINEGKSQTFIIIPH